MIKQFHEVHFLFNRYEEAKILNVYQNIEIISNMNELYAQNGGGDFSLYLGDSYLSLDFDTKSKRVGNFGGVVKAGDVSAGRICFPEKIINGILYVNEKGEFIGGCGWRVRFAEKYFYDDEKLLFQVGEFISNEPCFKFFKNAYCQLDCEGNLKGLLISDIKIKM